MEQTERIFPKGYLNYFLQTQMDGLTGHIDQAGYPFDCVEWGIEDVSPATTNEPWWRYEQTAYWVDGYTRCALMLGDEEKIAKAKQMIFRVLDHPQGTYLGPEVIADPSIDNYRWPHVVFFRACMALYDRCRDPKIPEAIRRHYLGDTADYSVKRNVLNVEIMLWAYGITGDKALLQKAVDAYERYNETCEEDVCDRMALSPKKPYAHGVSYNEYGKLGAILYRHTGEERYLKASVAAFDKAVRMFLLPGGCICSNEHTISDNYYNSTETCNISDFTWSLSYLMKITKKAKYADWIERCVFNGGLGAVTEDFRALQYFSSANQVIADHQSNHNLFNKGGSWMRYAPNPGTECCPGNVNRFMPNYVGNLWGNEKEGVYCYLYGASEYVCTREGKSVRICEETDYPATDTVRLTIQTEVPFDLYYRVPLFMSGATLTVNGKSEEKRPSRSYHCLHVEKSGTVELAFRADVVKHERSGRVYFTRGALTYCLAMKGKRVEELPEGKQFPNYHMYADAEWRYAIKKGEVSYTPCENFRDFRLGTPLPYLTVEGVRIQNYDLEQLTDFYHQSHLKLGRKHPVHELHTFTPHVLPNSKLQLDDATVSLRLYPYGAGKMRITVFNLID